MTSFPILSKLDARNRQQSHFALSHNPAISRSISSLNNSDIYKLPYKLTCSLHSREPAKLSTVSLVGRKDQKRVKAKSSHAGIPGKDKRELTNCSGSIEYVECRPPLEVDLDVPKPTMYDPPTYLPWETTAPSYTMRPKTQPEKDCGGDRVAWNKQWFASHDIWTYRAHFDERCPWPSPAHYSSKGTVGKTQFSLTLSPSYSMGKRRTIVFSKKDSESEPSPNQYNYSKPKLKLMNKFPSYTIQEGRRGGTTIWSAREPVPGPGTYNPFSYRLSSKRCAPCFSMSRGVREMGITRNCTL